MRSGVSAAISGDAERRSTKASCNASVGREEEAQGQSAADREQLRTDHHFAVDERAEALVATCVCRHRRFTVW